MITLNAESTSGGKIWKPDTFIRNSVKSRLHEVIRPNNYLRIYPNGDVLYSARYNIFKRVHCNAKVDKYKKDVIFPDFKFLFARITTTVHCMMSFKQYPMGQQKCAIQFSSYAYATNNLVYVWKHPNPISIGVNGTLHLPLYSVGIKDKGVGNAGISFDTCDAKTATGK